MGNEVSTSGDVYSYGVLLLEMFTAKRPIDNNFNNNLSLYNFAKMALHKYIREHSGSNTVSTKRKGGGKL